QMPYQKRYAAASRFYAEAFAAEPKLAENPEQGNRYNAACAAALAGCGQGRDASRLEDNERARLRKQALGWLRADLGGWAQKLSNQADKTRPVAVQTLQHWLTDTDFAGVRGAEALSRLPAEAERQSWQQLWNEVSVMLKRVQGTTASEKKQNK